MFVKLNPKDLIILNSKIEKSMKKEKTFMENAEGFMSSWQDDYAEKNKEILERKKKRDQESQEIYDEIGNIWDEIKTEMSGTGKELYEALKIEFNDFSKAVKEGTANLTQGMELEKHAEQLKFFMEKAGEKGAENFAKLSMTVKNKISEYEKAGKEKIEKENSTGLHNKIKDIFS